MNLFDVYSLWNIEPVCAKGCRVWDKDNVEYLDFTVDTPLFLSDIRTRPM